MTALRRSMDALLGRHDRDGACRRGAFPSDAPSPFAPEKDDARGLLDCFYCAGGDHGLELCTESLGSESCDARMQPEEEEALLEGTAWGTAAAEHLDDGDSGNSDDDDDDGGRLEEEFMRRERKKAEFPPPLRWMAGSDGRRTGIIRAERRDGRLVLTEVRIERPEVFRSVREGGRLRLQPVESEQCEEEREEQGVEEPAATSMDVDVERPEKQIGLGEGFRRCQNTLGSNHEVPSWWHHRFVTMA